MWLGYLDALVARNGASFGGDSWAAGTPGPTLADYLLLDLLDYHDSLGGEKAKKLMTKEEIERGFAHIEKFAPRSNFRNAALHWMTIKENDPDSPIFGWPSANVRDAIANLESEANLARTQYDYPLCYFDFAAYFQKVLDRVLPLLPKKSLLFFGDPGTGKSPACYILAMMCAR